tara:strand:- start:1233 stop:1706 length:474 start_codon:yes stop_codon:yes gene_type:complete
MGNINYFNPTNPRPINGLNLLNLVKEMREYTDRFLKVATRTGARYEQGMVANLPSELGYRIAGIRFNDLMNEQDNTGWNIFITQYQAAYENLRQLVDQALTNPDLLSDPATERFIRNEWMAINGERRRFFGWEWNRAHRAFIQKVREERQNRNDRGR